MAQITGTNGNDNISGTIFRDTIFGLGGRDIIDGAGSNDEINGGEGNDVLGGGRGDDDLFGQGNDDEFSGDEGADSMDGGPGVDFVNYGSFDDPDPTQINLRSGGVGRGGTAEGDTYASIENVLSPGSVEIIGSDVSNKFTIIQRSTSEVLFGHGGDDTFVARLGRDRIDGGLGSDTVDYSQVFNSGFTIKAVTTNLSLGFGPDGSTLTSIENITGSQQGADVLIGNSGANVLKGGGGGNDRLEGRGGNDTYVFELTGSPFIVITDTLGADTLLLEQDLIEKVVQVGADLTLLGHNGQSLATINDHFAGHPVETLRSPATGEEVTLSTLLTGGDASGIIAGTNADERLKGHGGDDALYGNVGRDRLLGGVGHDTLHGGRGQDSLLGGSGNDKLYGKRGQDSLLGGRGDDQLYGGDGADGFQFAAGFDEDKMHDFEDDVDTIVLNGSSLGLTSRDDALSHAKVVHGDTVFTFSNGDMLIVQSIMDKSLLRNDIEVL